MQCACTVLLSVVSGNTIFFQLSHKRHDFRDKINAHINVCVNVLGGKTGAQNIVKKTKQYQEKWLQHVQRMDTNRIPKQALQYKPKGRRNIGRPRKRWRDKLHFEDQGTGNTPNTPRT